MGDTNTESSQTPFEEMLPLLYDQLRELAAFHMARERGDHTLQPTAVVHELYLRLPSGYKDGRLSRYRFMALASELIRRILIDHARRRATLKRGGAHTTHRMDVDVLGVEHTPGGLVEVHEAIESLRALHERQAAVVELRFFGGLTNRVVAEILGVSVETVKADWRVARAWLRRRLEN